MISLKKIPLKNMKAHPVRTVILFVLTFAQALCIFGGMMMVQDMRRELSAAEERLGADLLVYPTQGLNKLYKDKLLMMGTPVEVYKDRSMLSKMDYCEGISAVTYQIYLSDTLEDGSNIWIYGYEPETDFVLSPWLEEGKDLDLPKGSVAVGSRVKMSRDRTLELFGKDWPIALRLTETGSELDLAVFVPMETLKDMIRASVEAGIDTYASIDPATDFSAALVRVDDAEKVQGVTDWINIYVRRVTAVRSDETLVKAASGIRGTTGMMGAIALLIWLVLLAALGITQSILMKERTKEIFVWHTIGASRGIVSRIMLSEALIIYLAGAAAGTLAASIVMGFFPGALAAIVVTVAAGLIITGLAVKSAAKKLGSQMLLTI